MSWDSTKPSGPRTTAVHAVDIEDIDSVERGYEVYLEEEEESARVNLAEIVAKGPHVCKALSKASKDQRPTTAQVSKFSGASQKADLIDRKILKFLKKAAMGVNQNPFPNAQVNIVNANFPRPDQPRPRLDLGGSTKATTERRAREIPVDPKARGKAKMYSKVAEVPETKVSTKEKPPKAIVLCSRCQCEVTLEVVPPKPKEPTKEPTKGLIKEQTKDQVQMGGPRSFERSMLTSSVENYGPHSPRGGMEVRPNKRPLHEYQDRYERPRYQPKRRNQHAPLRYEDIDSPDSSQNQSMWISVGEGKSLDVAYVSRPCPADGSGVSTFKVQTQRRANELEWANKRQAQLERLVKLREKLQLEESELAKADVVASLEAAAAEEIKIRREWVNGRV
ncbi:hypothetical protein L3X38_042393 [Prunus dulcis]|uniref:Uncharacterized protein n=1 Tax=Prunus dulcis TaxID=3755 RepID=A0AAD4UW78_PRUDU|nr:hypothetical protein L3X38_042393 [Prunus dulcis]